jgi:hypothetical protein
MRILHLTYPPFPYERAGVTRLAQRLNPLVKRED